MAMIRGALAAGWRAHAEVRLGDGETVADVLAELDDAASPLRLSGRDPRSRTS